MQKRNNVSEALSSPEHVREIALVFIQISEAIHHALRELSNLKAQNAACAYALLTEEYALRSRANMLMIEATRFARPGMKMTQQEMLGALEAIYTKLKNECILDELAELITDVVLFANSIASTKNHIVLFLLNELKKSGSKP